MGEEYALYRKGGSVGEKDDHPRHGKLISKHATPEEAKGEAKAHNKTLSAGEKKYYRMKYHVKPMKEETLDEISKKLAFKAVRSGTYSDYDPDYNHPKRDAIKKAIGKKWGSEAEKHANKMVGDEGTGKIKSSGKSNRLKIDMLRTSNRVTASGKKNKQDVASTKRNIKDRLGTHPKPGHLPEESLDEVLTKKMSAGQVIHDFVHSDNPKFKGKSVKQRQKMALGAYYGMHPEKSKGE